MTAPAPPVTFTQDPQHPLTWRLHGHGLTHYDSAGCRWITQRARGWRGSAPPRTDRTARLTASGSYRGEAFRDERIVVLDGRTKAPSAGARADAEERIGQLLPDGIGIVELYRMGENGIAQVRYVELDDVIDPVPTNARWFTWSLQLAAADPRKFAPQWSSSVSDPLLQGTGGVVSTGSGVVSTGLGVVSGTAARLAVAQAVGAGTVANPVVYELVGPLADVVVVDAYGTSQVRYRGALGAGQSAFINTDSHEQHAVPGAAGPINGYGALLGDADARSAVSVSGGWPQLMPGQVGSYVMDGQIDVGALLRVHTRGAWS